MEVCLRRAYSILRDMTEEHCIIHAPFTAEQVTNLWAWQQSRWVHPFTCVNRSDEYHGWTVHVSQMGALWPYEEGWYCPWCDYKQDWAHSFMVDGSIFEINRAMGEWFNGARYGQDNA